MRSFYDRAFFALGAAAALILVGNEFRVEDKMPLGGDFAQIWLAGVLVKAGQIATLYDPAAFSKAGRALIAFFYAPKAYWSYPPTTLLLASPFALLSYPAALMLFSLLQTGLAATAGAAITSGRLARGVAIAIAVVSPALLLSLVFGQFSAPVACLLVLGVFALPSRPEWAGVLFGLVILKPQFGILLPLVLMAGGHRRAFASAALTVIALSVASVLVFGPGVWADFIAKTMPQQVGLIGDLANYGSVAHSVRDTLLIAGASPQLAGAIQLVAAIIAVLAATSVFRRTTEPHLRAFVLSLAAVTLLPYANLYDAAIPAMGALALYGSRRALPAAAHIAVLVIWLAPAIDGLLAMNGMFRFAPVFEVAVLAATLSSLESRAWRRWALRAPNSTPLARSNGPRAALAA